MSKQELKEVEEKVQEEVTQEPIKTDEELLAEKEAEKARLKKLEEELNATVPPTEKPTPSAVKYDDTPRKGVKKYGKAWTRAGGFNSQPRITHVPKKSGRKMR